ncbi:anhydro-N-acetylmuramic acid kinase [Magnetospirillum sulfuroxidans]|uniref:Anhydro-N-acetylmuramic acid kinase n=1 Tax=Magnetospirillum sulfuroxidans TaxID=611300 RepID=A0ABS5IBD6_9PROT|nr:anhydro-N-acetylmuramic acid kinase [Magnetospirillum sulfuroxidans]MBR9971581.1 anhydro-N-acetylmuramic acid kinase [Magnetospirillum sulfuroxidans]
MNKLALGLMSGTSLDGIDAALVETDGETVTATGAALTVAYDDGLRAGLRGVLGGGGPVAEIERRLTEAHAQVVTRLLDVAGISAAAIDVIGFHGHTILHRPDQRRTWQIGDAALLARLTGVTVVNDFRSADVVAGGQGAPLVPVYHAALAHDLAGPLAVLNVGGVGNVTWIGADGRLLAFDTGPGNALVDDWALRHTGMAMDMDGALAAAGQVDMAAVEAFSRHAYFAASPPKSLDRDDFQSLAATLVAGKSAADGAATLTAFTARAVAMAATHCPIPPRRWLVCGGGRRNPTLMAALAAELGTPVEPVEQVGWDGDALEAQAFAFLAVRSLRGLALTFPGTTGIDRPLTGGRVTVF